MDRSGTSTLVMLRVTEHPTWVPQEACDDLIGRMVGTLSAVRSVRAVYQLGYVGAPGISDIDLLAVFDDGALTLAVGDIIGGNTFDVLFVAAGDIAFREGSIYHAVGDSTIFILALTVLLTSVLAAGLIYREKRGIGFEGLAILGIYVAGFMVLFFAG